MMFEQLNGDGRVWIYASARLLDNQEALKISQHMNSFCKSWQAHGNQLHADFEIVHNQILILAVDEHFEAASGCSIDSSVAEFRQIDQTYDLDLFNRTNIFFDLDGYLEIIPMNELNLAFKKGLINEDSLIYNNAISTLGQLRNEWLLPLHRSWAKNKISQIA